MAGGSKARGVAKPDQPAISPVMATLSRYMSAAGNRALPAPVKERTRLHILDTFAAMVSGAELPPGRAAIDFARAYGGRKIASVAGSNVRCGPMEAALANGVLAHADETDDSHTASRSHPGCAVVPAVLAVGEQFGISGSRFLRAVALGYDIGPRVTMTFGVQYFQREQHKSSHSVAGLFGAAAGAGCAAALNATQMRWLLDYTAQQASGIGAWQRDTDHMEKAFVFGGMPARNGVTAALLVAAGWTGVDDILSGDDNYLLAYAPHADPNGLVDQLGMRFEIANTTVKKWSVGSPIQAPLDALELILTRHPFTADQVRDVELRMALREARVVNNRDIPDICLQHMVAVMLTDGTVTFHAAHDERRMRDKQVLAQRAKVRLTIDDTLDRHPKGRAAAVEITLTDGTKLREQVEAVRGTPANPMPRGELVAKCRDLMAPVLGKTECDKLIASVLDLDAVKDIRALGPLLRRRSPSAVQRLG